MKSARRQVERIERGTQGMARYVGVIYSKLPYAYGIEYGRHQKSGKLARRAGGAQYMRRAVDTVLGSADHDLSEGLNKVTAPGKWVLKRLGLWARRLARKNAPRGPRRKWKSKGGKTYRLRRAIQYKIERRR